MKKSPKRIAAILALAAIAALIICFVISAFQTGANSSNTFFALFFGIIAVPILLWIVLFCYGRFTKKRTIAELYPEQFWDDILTRDEEAQSKDTSQK